MRDLLAGELFVSAEILGGLVLARSRAHSPDGSGNASASSSSKQPGPAALGSHADSLELCGDALMGLGESRRALVRDLILVILSHACVLAVSLMDSNKNAVGALREGGHAQESGQRGGGCRGGSNERGGWARAVDHVARGGAGVQAV